MTDKNPEDDLGHLIRQAETVSNEADKHGSRRGPAGTGKLTVVLAVVALFLVVANIGISISRSGNQDTANPQEAADLLEIADETVRMTVISGGSLPEFLDDAIIQALARYQKLDEQRYQLTLRLDGYDIPVIFSLDTPFDLQPLPDAFATEAE